MQMKDRPIALVVGAGDHLGGAIARRFAREGFHLVVTRRRGDLQTLSSEIDALGSSATAIHSDARDEVQVSELVNRVESELGPIRVAVFNVGGNVQFDICDTTTRIYRKVWEMCALAGFLVGREVARKMLARKEGTILFTGASASLRGGRGFAAFSGGKHALRALAQSMARELGPQGIHVGHVVVDGLLRNEATAEFLPDLYASKGDDGIIEPDDLAEVYWQLHNQPRSAWTFEQDVRPFSESW
ncbi:SDR family NAD(P)-dependent oxidoreductase [Marinobacter sp. V034]|uniref:SDR family NAD(P)-dependent oxidoreductase n=1 Tax=Marinobacter TaxID=2742 RepID=UPI004044B1A6